MILTNSEMVSQLVGVVSENFQETMPRSMRLWSTGRQVDNSMLQRLLPFQARRLLHTSERGEKVPARIPLRSFSLLGNKQSLQETRLKARARVESDNKDFIFPGTG